MIEMLKRSSVSVARDPGVPAGPLFLSVTSQGDLAAKLAFPLGQGLSAVTKSFRDYGNSAATPQSPSQSTFFTHTAGHIPYLFSHEVVPLSSVKADCRSVGDVVQFFAAGHCYVLRAKDSRWNNSPYWITTVPSAIIPDHSDIFTEQFVQMLTEAIAHYAVVDSPEPTRMLMK
jgi:hypothetical protein